jgi:replicative superfamily II helicase
MATLAGLGRRPYIHCLITTSTVSTGVNLPGVGHVAVLSTGFGAYEVAQMIGRCGRRTMGFARSARAGPART